MLMKPMSLLEPRIDENGNVIIRSEEEIITKNIMLKTESGNVTSNDPLVSLLYFLMRDNVPCGHMEMLVSDMEKELNMKGPSTYTNGYLTNYCIHLANRIHKVLSISNLNTKKE